MNGEPGCVSARRREAKKKKKKGTFIFYAASQSSIASNWSAEKMNVPFFASHLIGKSLMFLNQQSRPWS
jgi:hypothetical protein